MGNKKLIFTKHAGEKIAEYGLDSAKVKARFRGAKRVKLPFRRRVYKSLKYGTSQGCIDYYFNARLLYTVREYPRHFVILTVTPKKKKALKLRKKGR